MLDVSVVCVLSLLSRSDVFEWASNVSPAPYTQLL